MRKRFLLILPLLFICLTGCLPTYVIDDIRLVQALGYDALSGERILGTATVPNFSGSGSQQAQSQSIQSQADSFSVVSHTGKTVPFKLQAKSQEPLKIGKLEVILFSKELAQRGVEQFVDFFHRDPDIGRQLFVAVVDGKAKDVLNGQYATGVSVPNYINKMIEQNSNRNLPESNLHEFLYGYFGNGMDPFLPIIKKVGDHIEIEGIALFKTNRMQAVISFDDSFVFKMMYQPFSQGNYEIKIGKHDYVSVENIGSKVSYQIENGASSHPHITINVKLNGVIREAQSHKKTTKYSQKITKIIEKDLNKKANRIVNILQAKDIDPLAIGDKVRSRTRNWELKKWQQTYPHADIDVKIHLDIVQTGITS